MHSTENYPILWVGLILGAIKRFEIDCNCIVKTINMNLTYLVTDNGLGSYFCKLHLFDKVWPVLIWTCVMDVDTFY